MLHIERSLADIEHFVPGPEKVLSMYLDTDRRSDGGRNVRAQLLALAGSCREGLSDSRDASDLDAAVTAAEELLKRERPRASAVALFVSASGSPGLVLPMRTAVTPEARWDADLYLTPLLAQLDEHERMLVMLLDSRRARLFRTFMGEIEEIESFENEYSHRNPRGANRASAQHGGGGRSVAMGYDSARAQRRDEEHVRQHMTRALAALARADGTELINRILVAGPVAIVAEFQRRLPVGLRRRVSTSMRVSTTASASDVLEALKVVEAEIERSGEVDLVEELLENFDGSRVGALGVAEAVADGQVQTLVYARGTTLSGAECVGCGWLVPQDAFPLPEACPRCAAELRSHDDLLDTMVKRVREHGGRVEEVREEAAARLAQLEGVGALLRYTPAAPQTDADVSVS